MDLCWIHVIVNLPNIHNNNYGSNIKDKMNKDNNANRSNKKNDNNKYNNINVIITYIKQRRNMVK